MGLFDFLKKKEDENATLPKNEAEKWVTYAYAMWSEAANGDWHYIAGSVEKSKQEGASMRVMLRRDWGVSNKAQLLDMVSYLTSLYKQGTDCEPEDIESGAWDLCRACQILGMGYVGGYIPRDEMMEASFGVARVMQKYYHSWIELYESYVKGYRAWRADMDGDDQTAVEERKALCDKLLNLLDGPSSVDWNMTF